MRSCHLRNNIDHGHPFPGGPIAFALAFAFALVAQPSRRARRPSWPYLTPRPTDKISTEDRLTYLTRKHTLGSPKHKSIIRGETDAAIEPSSICGGGSLHHAVARA